MQLEYISTTKGNGHGILANSQNIPNGVSALQQPQASVLKVAMFGEFEMAPETVSNNKWRMIWQSCNRVIPIFESSWNLWALQAT